MAGFNLTYGLGFPPGYYSSKIKYLSAKCLVLLGLHLLIIKMRKSLRGKCKLCTNKVTVITDKCGTTSNFVKHLERMHTDRLNNRKSKIMKNQALRVSAIIVLFGFLIICHQALFDKLQVRRKWFTDDHRDNQTSALLVFKEKPLVIWTTDFHIGPIHDLKTFLKPMGVRFIDKNLDYTRCRRTRTCEGMKTLKLINPHNVRNLNYSWIPKFYQLYANDTEMDSVDAFGCFHYPSLCELYEPFNKSLIILSTIRYELGRFGKERWTRWNENLIRYAANPKNLIAANNLYDVNYIKYFTGIEPVWLPSFSSHPNVKYNRSRESFLIAHNTNTGFFNTFIQQYTKLCKIQNCTVRLGEVYGLYGNNYKYSDIVAHQGIVHVPYQVSVMSFFEHYRMDIPIFAPSLKLLIEWEWKHWAMRERTWQGAHGPQPVGSAIEPHPSQRSIPDPNCYKEETVRYWVKFSDYYQFPHYNLLRFNRTFDHSVAHDNY